MATEYSLQRADGQPFGSFAEVQDTIRRLFPGVKFFWTTSGAEKIRMAKERGIEMPPAIREICERLPSLLEGVVEDEDYHVTFGLGHQEPVTALHVTPRGSAAELEEGLAALEELAGAPFRIAGE
jgi:hypothetical protein